MERCVSGVCRPLMVNIGMCNEIRPTLEIMPKTQKWTKCSYLYLHRVFRWLHQTNRYLPWNHGTVIFCLFQKHSQKKSKFLLQTK